MTDEPIEATPEQLHVIKRRAWLTLSGLGLFMYLQDGMRTGWPALTWIIFGAMYLENVVSTLSRSGPDSTASD